MNKKWLCLLAVIAAIGSGLAVAPTFAQTASTECSDGIDNDRDGATDYPEDLHCNEAADGDESGPCNDGLDNDSDGAVDYADDASCLSPRGYREEAECSDGVDNDQDGRIDVAEDPHCSDAADGEPSISQAHGWITHLSVVHRRGRLQGRVGGGGRSECRVDRAVRISRIQPGPNPVVWRAASGPRGFWTTDRIATPGRYRAVTPGFVFTTSAGSSGRCTGDTSDTIRVPRR